MASFVKGKPGRQSWYCECCGHNYVNGVPDCRCEYNQRCNICKACVQHCGCKKDANHE